MDLLTLEQHNLLSPGQDIIESECNQDASLRLNNYIQREGQRVSPRFAAVEDFDLQSLMDAQELSLAPGVFDYESMMDPGSHLASNSQGLSNNKVALETEYFATDHNECGNLQSTQAASTDQGAKPPKHRKEFTRLPKSSTRILKDWFISHSSHPYPTEKEKGMLQDQTGLTVRQISHWFVNARRRGNVTSAGHSTLAYHPPTPVSVSLPQTSTTGEWGKMSPFDRWRNSPPEDEAATVSAIANAVANADNVIPEHAHNYCESAPSGHFPLPAHSIVSFETSNSGSSTGSSRSARSLQPNSSTSSLGSLQSNDRRRRRRRASAGYHSSLVSSQNETARRIYQCTFCTDLFKSKYDWTRHEGTLHLVLEKWTCLPFGPRYCHPSEQIMRCALCNLENPSDSHLQSHGYDECKDKPLSARTFYRKDHLQQHLRVIHGVCKVLPLMANWKSKINQINSRCGFCGDRFVVWSERNDHLAGHFRAGARMKDWQGDRGLDPAVALLVENAMPPYLIGIESDGLEPFSASRAILKKSITIEDGQASPSLFESLTARLSEYVKAARNSGDLVSDESLRKEARIIIFGGDDPWNQTPADNVEWLNFFKRGHGLDSGSCELLGSCVSGPETDAVAQTRPSAFGESFAPFTLDNMRNAAGLAADFLPLQSCGPSRQDPTARLTGASQLLVPWAWQTPECLAEFRQMCQVSQPGVVQAASGCTSALSACEKNSGLMPTVSQHAGGGTSEEISSSALAANRNFSCNSSEGRGDCSYADHENYQLHQLIADEMMFPFDAGLQQDQVVFESGFNYSTALPCVVESYNTTTKRIGI
jgi:hypothetical protein